MPKMVNDVLHTRSGRKLEVREYGDAAGHPVFFFHGLIGSHYQASYIADQAREHGQRIIAPNRPGGGASEFIERASPLEAVNGAAKNRSRSIASVYSRASALWISTAATRNAGSPKLAKSSSSPTVLWTTHAEFAAGCHSSSGATSGWSVVSSLRVLRCCLCEKPLGPRCLRHPTRRGRRFSLRRVSRRAIRGPNSFL
jgi:hypothetical protein